MPSDYSGSFFKINNEPKICGKSLNFWKLNNTHVDKPWVKEKVKRESKSYSELNKNKSTLSKLVRC